MSTKQKQPLTELRLTEPQLIISTSIAVLLVTVLSLFEYSSLSVLFALGGFTTGIILSRIVYWIGYTKRASSRLTIGGTLLGSIGSLLYITLGSFQQTSIFLVAFATLSLIQLKLVLS